MASVNTYLSFKQVRNFTNRAKMIVSGTLADGNDFSAGFDPDTQSFILERAGKTPRRMRINLERLAASVFCAADDDEGVWEPLADCGGGFWGNSVISAHATPLADGKMVHVSYHRRDRAPIRDWRVGQRIKNEVCGPEWEAVEVYPAESRVVDTSNEFHLWCAPKMPFGFEKPDRLTQEQCDHFTEISGMVGDGPVQRDPIEDTSGSVPLHMDLKNPIRVPDLGGADDAVG
jgi:hypothetical protein